MSKLPFEGIRVADFGWILATPRLTQWLATLGAEVIKIESKVNLCTIRTGTHGGWLDGVGGVERTGGFNTLNYSKRSCCLDMTQPRAREMAYRLIAISDIVVEAFTTPVAQRFGLAYPELKKINPEIILLSCSALGRTGPLRDMAGMGPNSQIYSGVPSLVGYPGRIPGCIGGTWPDYMEGMAMVFGLLAALHHRRKTGEGQWIDVGMSEVCSSMIPQALFDYTMNGRIAGPRGNRDDVMVPHNVYRCQGEDKWVAIAVGTQEEWKAFCQATGHPEWQRDERFADGLARWHNQEELDRLITEWTKQHTNYEVMEILQRAGVAAGPSLNTEELINDPQIQHRGLLFEIDHPGVYEGQRLVMGVEGKFSAINERQIFPTPLLDQDNYYVFHDLLGIPKEEVDRLIEEKVIY